MEAKHLSFSELKTMVTFQQVLEDKGLLNRFRQRGDRLIGPCPIHDGDNANACVINLSRNLWRCFTRCDSGGDVVEFVRRFDDIGYAEVARYLYSLVNAAKTEGYCSPLSVPETSHNHFKPYRRRLSLIHATPLLKKKGIHPHTAHTFETGLYPSKGYLQGCVAVRLYDQHGRPLGYAGRRLNTEEIERWGKWKFPNGFPKSKIIYNFHRTSAQLDDGLVVVEGPWSVMRLAQLGIPAVALLGVYLSKVQEELIIKAKHVVLMLDGDGVGRKAALRISRRLKPYTSVKLFALEDDIDPDDLSDEELSQVKSLLP